MFRKNNFEKNNIGKNNNSDYGSNKNNKLKQKFNNSNNSEINNFNYNPNQVIVELIREIGLKEREIENKVLELKKCENCSFKINELINQIDNQLNTLSKEYDYEKQIYNSLSPIIYNVDPLKNALYNKKNEIKNFYVISCKKHEKLFNEIKLDRTEVNSFKKSLEILKK